MPDSTFANTNGSMPTAAVAVESKEQQTKHRGIDITYKVVVQVPQGIVVIPADGSIRAVHKAGIESVAITEAARKYPKIVGYAVRECDLVKVKQFSPDPA